MRALLVTLMLMIGSQAGAVVSKSFWTVQRTSTTVSSNEIIVSVRQETVIKHNSKSECNNYLMRRLGGDWTGSNSGVLRLVRPIAFGNETMLCQEIMWIE